MTVRIGHAGHGQVRDVRKVAETPEAGGANRANRAKRLEPSRSRFEGKTGPQPMRLAPELERVESNAPTFRVGAGLQSLTVANDRDAGFGSKGLSKAEVFTAISELRSKGFTNANDLYTYLKRDYGLDARDTFQLYGEWMEVNMPEVVARNRAASEAAQAAAAAGAAKYNKQLGIEPPTPAVYAGSTAALEQAVAASLAQGFSIADTKKGAFEKYAVTQDQWNAINWANVPGGSTRRP